jgi:hypothetical protein
MRSLIVLMTAAVAMTAGACSPDAQTTNQRREVMNTWAVNDYFQDSVESAIVSQHTLYPYHFISNGAELNELGARDLSVLAKHYRDNPGTLTVRRANTTADLYTARLEMVTALLVEHGVDTDRVSINNRHAGGEGLASERVLVILEEKMDAPLSDDDEGLSSFSNDD